MGTVQN